MSRAAPTTPTHPNAGLRSERALIALRSRLRRVAIGEVLTAGVGLVLVALLAEGLADFVLRLPSWLRVLLLRTLLRKRHPGRVSGLHRWSGEVRDLLQSHDGVRL